MFFTWHVPRLTYGACLVPICNGQGRGSLVKLQYAREILLSTVVLYTTHIISLEGISDTCDNIYFILLLMVAQAKWDMVADKAQRSVTFEDFTSRRHFGFSSPHVFTPELSIC